MAFYIKLLVCVEAIQNIDRDEVPQLRSCRQWQIFQRKMSSLTAHLFNTKTLPVFIHVFDHLAQFTLFLGFTIFFPFKSAEQQFLFLSFTHTSTLSIRVLISYCLTGIC